MEVSHAEEPNYLSAWGLGFVSGTIDGLASRIVPPTYIKAPHTAQAKLFQIKYSIPRREYLIIGGVQGLKVRGREHKRILKVHEGLLHNSRLR